MRLIASIFLASSLFVSAQIQPNVMQELLTASVISASAVWAPTNAYGWWHADSITANDGDAITNWTDSSGGHHFNVFSNYAAYAPYFTNIAAIGKPALYWPSTTQIYALTNAFGVTLPQPITMLLVVQGSRLGAGIVPYMLSSIASTPRQDFAVNFTADGTYLYGMRSFTAVQQGGSASIVNWCLLTVCFNGASSFVRTNGVLSFAVSGTPGPDGTQGITLGNRYADASGANRFKGGIAELIVYRGLPATNDLQWVENNLKTKYGL